MKKRILRIIALCLCAAVAVTCVASTAMAAPPENDDVQTSSANIADIVPSEYKSSAAGSDIVYVLSSSDGAAKRAIVCDDDGNETYYTKDLETALPISVKVTYFLDDMPVSAEEISGKSGRVRIRFDYINNCFRAVDIDGENENICVPFAAITGVLLDGDVFSNVEVKNGKTVGDGSRTAVVGLALPGMAESLGLDGGVEIPSYVEISAYAEKFSLDMTLTLVTSEIFKNVNMEDIGIKDVISDMINELEDAMNRVIDGSKQLYEGLGTLLEKTGELANGVDELSDGAGSLLSGTDSLLSGAKSLSGGAAALCEGLDTLASNNLSILDGANQVFQSLLSAANSQIAAAGLDIPELTVYNYAAVIDAAVASLDSDVVYAKALTQVTAGVDAMGDTLYVTYVMQNADALGVYTTAVSYEILTSLMQNGYTEEQATAYLQTEAGQNAVSAALASLTDEQKSQIATAAAASLTSAQKAQIRAGAISQTMASDEVRSQLEAASSGRRQLSALKGQLDGYNEFYVGLIAYTNGVSSAADGAKELSSGAARLNDGAENLSKGAKKLYDGTLTLKNSMPELIEGVSALGDGAKELFEGLCEFDESGVRKIAEAFENDVEKFISRIEAVVGAAKDYGADAFGFAGGANFIYKTAGV